MELCPLRSLTFGSHGLVDRWCPTVRRRPEPLPVGRVHRHSREIRLTLCWIVTMMTYPYLRPALRIDISSFVEHGFSRRALVCALFFLIPRGCPTEILVKHGPVGQSPRVRCHEDYSKMQQDLFIRFSRSKAPSSGVNVPTGISLWQCPTSACFQMDSAMKFTEIAIVLGDSFSALSVIFVFFTGNFPRTRPCGFWDDHVLDFTDRLHWFCFVGDHSRTRPRKRGSG